MTRGWLGNLVAPALLIAAFAGVIPLARWALAVDRGLDPQDEALYLVAVMAPDRDAFWMTPWSWVTEPLWGLAGARVADFRLMGAVLLVAAFTCAWWAAILFSSRTTAGGAFGHSSRWWSVPLALVGGLGSAALFYSGFIRSPSYNWANLIGIVLAATGLTAWTGLFRTQHVRTAWWLGWASLGMGCFVSLPAKPSTPVFILLLAGALASVISGWRRALRLVLPSAGVLIGLAALATATGYWGSNPLQALLVMMEQPPAVADQSWLSAAREVIKLPLYIAYWCIQLWYVLAALALLGALAGFPGRWVRAKVGAAALMAVVGALVLLSWTGWLPALTTAHNYVLRPEAVGSTFMLLFACLLALLVDRRLGNRPLRSVSMRERDRLGVAAALVVCAVIFAFGTANGPFQQMTWTLGLVFLSMYVLVSLLEDPWLRRSSQITLVGVLAFGATWVIAESWNYGYDLRPMAEQTRVIEVGGAGGRLSVDPYMADSIHALRSLADKSGFDRGSPMVVVTEQWGAFEPVVLDATPIMSLMLGSGELAEYNIARQGSFPWKAAWLLVPGTCANPIVDAELMELVTDRTMSKFPAGYRCAGSEAGITLWKPGNWDL